MKWFLFLLVSSIPLLVANEENNALKVTGNYYASDQSIEISGVIDGSAYLAGAQILVDGEVLGDLFCIGGSVTITGKVTGNVRVIAGQVVWNGTAGQDLTVATGNFEASSESSVGHSALIFAANAESLGKVEKDARFYVSNLRFSGFVGNNLSIYAGALHLDQGTRVLGNLVYTSESKPTFHPRVFVGGQIEERTGRVKSFLERTVARSWVIGTRLATSVMNFFFSWIIGLFLLHFFRSKVFLATSALRNYPLRCFFSGLCFLFILPVIFFVLILSILGLPFALLLLAVNVFGFFTVKNVVVLAVSSLAFPRLFRRRPYTLFFLGLIVYFVCKDLPYLGGILSALTTIVGIGAVLMGNTPKVRQFLT